MLTDCFFPGEGGPTAPENTNFHFEVNAAHLEPALDRFSQFFVCPLFEADALDREKKAVDSENSKNLSNDFRKLYQLSKHLSNPHHVIHKFGTGNYETLKVRLLNVWGIMCLLQQSSSGGDRSGGGSYFDSVISETHF